MAPGGAWTVIARVVCRSGLGIRSSPGIWPLTSSAVAPQVRHRLRHSSGYATTAAATAKATPPATVPTARMLISTSFSAVGADGVRGDDGDRAVRVVEHRVLDRADSSWPGCVA